jgi:hypothetical protein
VSKNYVIGVLLLLAVASCITPFEPEIKETEEVIVINGMITDEPGMHYVEVSMSAPYGDPEFIPVNGCVVTVTDEGGEMVQYEPNGAGTYEAFLPASFLGVGKAYSLRVNTPEGEEYRSDYDTLLACPPIDSLYYEIETKGTSNPNISFEGIQFYSDMTGTAFSAKNFRWLLEETWEYRVPNIGEYRFDGLELTPHLTAYMSICYKTDTIKEVYTATNRLLSVNVRRRTPLNFVSSETPRLKIKYSLLVRQQSLTDQAYRYWSNLGSQAGEAGGLYQVQPHSAIGNLYNTQTPEAKVLGCFYATQQKTQRETVLNHFKFNIPEVPFCALDTLIGSFHLMGVFFPYYLIPVMEMDAVGDYLYGTQDCFDCRVKGGSNIRPEYW